LIYSLLTGNLREFNTGTYRDEIQCDKVNGTSRLDINVRDKAVCINDLRCVISFVTHDLEIGHTATALNITQEGLDKITELSTCELIVKLEQLEFGSCGNCLLEDDEQAPYVDPIKRRRFGLRRLITKEDNTFSGERDDRVNTSLIQCITLSLNRIKCKFGDTTDLTTIETSG